MHKCVIKKVKLINHDCLPILMLYIVLAYLMLFAALTNSVCLNNASFFFLFKYFLCQGYELSGEIALKNNHYYYYYIEVNQVDVNVSTSHFPCMPKCRFLVSQYISMDCTR